MEIAILSGIIFTLWAIGAMYTILMLRELDQKLEHLASAMERLHAQQRRMRLAQVGGLEDVGTKSKKKTSIDIGTADFK